MCVDECFIQEYVPFRLRRPARSGVFPIDSIRFLTLSSLRRNRFGRLFECIVQRHFALNSDKSSQAFFDPSHCLLDSSVSKSTRIFSTFTVLVCELNQISGGLGHTPSSGRPEMIWRATS